MDSKIKLLMFKTLSRNDTGETHSHQSGISIPKDAARAVVFPFLGIETLNPRVTIDFYDEDGDRWDFEYIYYNDKFHGKDSNRAHDEFRLTHVIDFLRKVKAHSGDKIWFGLDESGMRRIGLVKNYSTEQIAEISKVKKTVKYNILGDDEYESIIAEDIPILDPDIEIEPTVVKLNKNWTKVEF